MNIQKIVGNNKTTMLVISGSDYNKAIIEVISQISDKSVCYVTLNKTFDSLKEVFKKNKINMDNLVFIDCISKTFMKTPKQQDQCYYVSSPGALTEISLTLSKFLKHNFNYIIFDSLTNLIVYEKKAPVAKFVSNIVNNLRISDSKAIFYVLGDGKDSDLIEKSGMFVDKVVKWK